MNVTRQFVFIHMPKTGGTFAADVLRRIHIPRWLQGIGKRDRLLLTASRAALKLGLDLPYLELSKHGTCHDIPPRYSHLPIVSCIRNPFDWYVSNFKYQYWRTHPNLYPGLTNDPAWPKLDFGRFMYLSNTQWSAALLPGVPVNPSLGRLTVLFIKFYCRNPAEVAATVDDDDVVFDRIRKDMYDVNFLDTEHLNEQLQAFLAGIGYETERIAFIKGHPRVSPRGNRRPEERWYLFYTEELLREVSWRDRFIFRLFPALEGLPSHARAAQYRSFQDGAPTKQSCNTRTQ